MTTFVNPTLKERLLAAEKVLNNNIALIEETWPDNDVLQQTAKAQAAALFEAKVKAVLSETASTY